MSKGITVWFTSPSGSERTTVGRLALALILGVLLFALRGMISLIEASYPLGRGSVPAAIEYVGLAGLLSVVAAVAIASWIAPGWAVARILSPSDSPAVRALRAGVIAFLIQPLLLAVVVALGGTDLEPEAFRRYVLLGQVALLVGASLVPVPSSPDSRASHWTRDRTLILAAFAIGMIALLLPFIAWADLVPDGIEILTLGRSLTANLVPRYWTGQLPGPHLMMLTASYPIAWLVAVGGVGETAARLPVIGYAIMVALGVSALAELKARRKLTAGEFSVLLAGTGAVVLTISLNSAYDPYSTDIASPASIDLLAMVFLLAAIYFVFADDVISAALSAALMSLTRPTALLLFGLLAACVFVVERGWRNPRFRGALIALGAALLVATAYGLATDRGGSTLSRIRYLRFDDWARLRFLVIPSGVLPVLAWFGWRRIDRSARVLMLVAIAYFAFFYCMAFFSLHHFAPAMLLPLVTFWRGEANRESPGTSSWRLATTLGAIVAIWAALPTNFAVYRGARRVGSSIAYDVGNYSGNFAGVRDAFTGIRALDDLFESPFVRDPHRTRISESLSLMHYATLRRDRREPPQYAVQPSEKAPAEGMTRAGDRNGAALYVRDLDRWKRDQSTPPGPAPRSRLYDVSRPQLFRHLGLEAGLSQLDLFEAARRAKAALSDSSP